MEPQSPECPVCLQPYTFTDTIPRVLSCGHTSCETCLSKLPHPFNDTVRCPACTQLVHFPPTGPASLPKNIDLLRFCHAPGEDPNRKETVGHRARSFTPLVPKTWSDELFAVWKGWVLPYGAVSLEAGEGAVGEDIVRVGRVIYPIDDDDLSSLTYAGFRFKAGADVKVSAFPVGLSMNVGSGSGFRYGYLAWVMRCLSNMEDCVRKDLSLLLRVCSNRLRVCGAEYGLWGDVENGVLYLVSEMKNRGISDILAGLTGGFSGFEGGVAGFAIVAMEICEAFIGFNREGVVAGLSGIQCISTDSFGHAHIDLNKMLTMGRNVFARVGEFVSSRRDNGSKDSSVIFQELLENDVFLCPEILFELLKKEGVGLDDSNVILPITYGADVWVLGSTLIRLLFGEAFPSDIFNTYKKEDTDDFSWYMKWLENVASLLETRSIPALLRQTLLQCLKLDPESRPDITQIWKCIRGLIYEHLGSEMEAIHANADFHCLILGKICRSARTRCEALTEELQGRVLCGDVNGQVGKLIGEKLGDGFSDGKVKHKDLLAHHDCITGLAVGGGFLFSSSFDKTIQVWSLQDFTHSHTFRGHEHKIMAVIYVDWEHNCCITGDSGGGILMWDVSQPFKEQPVKKWYEEKDWRYSGIHSLAYANNGYLYTGGGDKLIKAWSLEDCTLFCSLSGHKAVVSSLIVSNGVLYSGSWDGTIRLWALSDHSPLTVLGEDIPGKAASVLSVAAHRDLLIAAYENGRVKVWRNDVFVKSVQLHNGAIFAVSVEDKWVITGGWNKTITIQEISGDDCYTEIRTLGSVPSNSVVTALLSWEGKLIAGCADKSVKVYYSGR